MISIYKKSVFACAILLLKTVVAGADVKGELRFTTNYVYRGYSKSDGGPAIQGNLDYEHGSGFYAGTWVSTVNFNDNGHADRAQVEIAPYLGWNWSLNQDWHLGSYLSRYFYNGKLFGKFSDYNELNAILHFRDMASLRIGWSDNYFNRNHHALNYELTFRYPFTDNLEASAGAGYSDSLQALQDDYVYWNAGISWFFKYGSMDLRYVQGAEFGLGATTHDPQHFEPKVATGNAVFSLSVGF